MRKRIIIWLCLYSGLLYSASAQLTYRFELGIGESQYIEHDIAKTVSGGIGYCFFEELTVFGGVNMFSQSSYIFPFEVTEDEKWGDGKTKRLTSFLLQAGVQYSLTLKTFTKDRDQWEYKRIGIFPELNSYFNPYLNRRYKIENDGEEFKAPYSTQFAHGIGGGVFYGSWKNYLALKYECNTIDNLESINRLVPDLEKDNKFNHVISLIFVFR